MEIIDHPLCDQTIGAPADMQDGSCQGLPVANHEDEHGKWSISFWKPGPEELAQLVAGGMIQLWVRASGRQHPVVAVGVQEAL